MRQAATLTVLFALAAGGASLIPELESTYVSILRFASVTLLLVAVVFMLAFIAELQNSANKALQRRIDLQNKYLRHIATNGREKERV